MPGDPVVTTILKVSTASGEITGAACAGIDRWHIYSERFITLTFVRWDLPSDTTLTHAVARRTALRGLGIR